MKVQFDLRIIAEREENYDRIRVTIVPQDHRNFINTSTYVHYYYYRNVNADK